MQRMYRIRLRGAKLTASRATAGITRRLLAAAIALMLIGTLIAGCGGEPEPPPPTIRPVKTIVVGQGASVDLTYPGTVRSADRVELSFRVRGPVIELPIKEGQTIQKGSLIGRIDPRDFQLAVDEAQASFQKAESDLQRYQRLYEQNAVPLSDLDFHQAQRDVARARIDQAEANLKYTRLTAPFTGEIGRRYIDRSENVEAGQPIASLVGTDQIEVVVDVPEAMRAYFSVGGARVNELYASFDFALEREFPLTIKEVASRADQTTRTFRVTLSMAQPEGLQIRSGMTATVTIVAELEETGAGDQDFIVPATAIGVDPEGKQYVWIVSDTDLTVTRRDVTIGEVTGTGSIFVLSGLEGGERIAVAAVSRLREGMRVRLWEQ